MSFFRETASGGVDLEDREGGVRPMGASIGRIVVLAALIQFAPLLLVVAVFFLPMPSARTQADQLLGQMRDRGNHSIELYDTKGTDDILSHLQAAEDIHDFTFNLTDVSEEGLRIVAGMRGLRRLELYGGRGITDAAIAHLRGKAGLEELVLRNTRVTNDGLVVLKELPDLKRLTIYQERLHGKDLGDAGLVHLAALSKLEELRIVGGWATDAAIRALEAKMPGCRVLREEKWQP
jgi:hypothetical protein